MRDIDKDSEKYAFADEPGEDDVDNQPFPKIVCLCGSGRFMDEFHAAEERETLAGNIVLTIGCNTKDVARLTSMSHHKPALDELHKRKIDLADEILVLNVDNYIGESTQSEIQYAWKTGKPVRFLETVDRDHCDVCREFFALEPKTGGLK